MSCLIIALTRSHTINKTTGEKINNKISKKKKTKIQHLNLKAPYNNVKIQSDETSLNYTKLFFCYYKVDVTLY